MVITSRDTLPGRGINPILPWCPEGHCPVLVEQQEKYGSNVVLVVLMVLFLRRMAASDETQKAIAATCHESQRQSIRAVEILEERSAALITRCTEVLGAAKDAIDRVERRLDCVDS